MNNSTSVLRAVAVATVGVGVVVLALGVSTSLTRLSAFWTDSDELSELAHLSAEILTDSLIAGGLHPQAINPQDPLLSARTIVIAEGMNEGVARRVVESLLYLDSIDKETPIDLYLYTSGGWLDSAFAIVDVMALIEAPVNVIAVGGCYSAGLVVLVAGTGTRSATENTILSVHANMDHDAREFKYDRYNEDRLESHFKKHAALPEAWYPLSGEPEQYYFDPSQAKSFGVIDEVVAK